MLNSVEADTGREPHSRAEICAAVMRHGAARVTSICGKTRESNEELDLIIADLSEPFNSSVPGRAATGTSSARKGGSGARKRRE